MRADAAASSRADPAGPAAVDLWPSTPPEPSATRERPGDGPGPRGRACPSPSWRTSGPASGLRPPGNWHRPLTGGPVGERPWLPKRLAALPDDPAPPPVATPLGAIALRMTRHGVTALGVTGHVPETAALVLGDNGEPGVGSRDFDFDSVPLDRVIAHGSPVDRPCARPRTPHASLPSSRGRPVDGVVRSRRLQSPLRTGGAVRPPASGGVRPAPAARRKASRSVRRTGCCREPVRITAWIALTGSGRLTRRTTTPG